MGAESKVTSKGQTTIPVEVRQALGIHAGDIVRYQIDGGEVKLIKKRSALEFAGVLHDPARLTLDIEDMNMAVGEAIENRYERSLDRD
jgi:AbrB family looped-hinge helix DNA binding protein